MKKLVIYGKADSFLDVLEMKELGYEIWCLGTDSRNNADRYYEFHGIEVDKRQMIKSPDPLVRKFSKILPLNNSIAIMLIEAYIEGYSEIVLTGCPMEATEELKKQKPCVAMVVGFLLGKGVLIEWDNSPDKQYYLDYII